MGGVEINRAFPVGEKHFNTEMSTCYAASAQAADYLHTGNSEALRFVVLPSRMRSSEAD